jgi:hypothetical protein
MRSRVRNQVLPWGFFNEGEDSYGGQGLGSLVELRFKAPPGTTGVPRGVVWGGGSNHPRNSEVLKKLGQIPSSVEYNL